MSYDFASAPTDTWMQTFTGKRFYPLNPNPDDIDIHDIAHALSLQCRFAGHCNSFYSVGEHSVRISYLCESEPIWGLMHDAAEAYIGDCIRPLKCTPDFGDAYRRVEHGLELAIAKRFGLALPMPPEVKHWDNVLLFTEQRDLRFRQGAPGLYWEGQEKFEPLEEVIVPWPPELTEKRFMSRYLELTGARK